MTVVWMRNAQRELRNPHDQKRPELAAVRLAARRRQRGAHHAYNVEAMEVEGVGPLPEDVLYRIARGDAKGRIFGTPRNPRPPTAEEFNPRVTEVRAGDLAATIVERKHGIFPEQAQRVGQLGSEDLIRFRLDDPISATPVRDGLSLTGGHHRTNEIIRRVETGQLAPNSIIRILLHD